MHNCIFNGHCTEEQLCNSSCPILAQTSYLLERNDISMSNSVFSMDAEEMSKYVSLLAQCKNRTSSIIVSSGMFTNEAADAVTYCAICENWKGSQLHCTVYNLKFAQYIEALQKSWSYNANSSGVDYMEIWAAEAQVLIISNIDFVNFKDFQCQKLLSLLQSRVGKNLTTIIVSPPVSSLVGEGQFFSRLTNMLSKQRVGDEL